jgi:hypothetical protein
MYSCTSQADLSRISIPQKKAIRTTCREQADAYTASLFKEAGILPFDKVILQIKLNFTHSIEYNYAPSPPPQRLIPKVKLKKNI